MKRLPDRKSNKISRKKIGTDIYKNLPKFILKILYNARVTAKLKNFLNIKDRLKENMRDINCKKTIIFRYKKVLSINKKKKKNSYLSLS